MIDCISDYSETSCGQERKNEHGFDTNFRDPRFFAGKGIMNVTLEN